MKMKLWTCCWILILIDYKVTNCAKPPQSTGQTLTGSSSSTPVVAQQTTCVPTSTQNCPQQQQQQQQQRLSKEEQFRQQQNDKLYNQRMANESAIGQKPNVTIEELEAIWSNPNDVKFPLGGPIPTRPLIGTKYTIFRKAVSWFRAHELCLKHGMILATFPTEESWKSVAKAIFDFSVYDATSTEEWLGARRYWMGLNDLAMEGEWRWFDTGELLSWDGSWSESAPDHITYIPEYIHAIRTPRTYTPTKKDGPEHCGSIWNPTFNAPTGHDLHVWDDSLCIGEGKYQYFICENK